MTTPMTIPHTAEELASLRADVARWRNLAQEWRRELDTVYERIDEHLPHGPDWGNVLARIQAAGNEIDRLRATIDTHDPPSPPLDLVPLTVAHRCECCGRMMPVDTIAAHFYDDDSGDVYAHAGPCVADDRHITIACETGDEEVPARVIGMWAMHLRGRLEAFNVTHVPSGRALISGIDRTVAWSLVKRLGERCSGPGCRTEYRCADVPFTDEWAAVKQTADEVIAWSMGANA